MLTLKKINGSLSNKGLELIRWKDDFYLKIIDVKSLPLPGFVKTTANLANGQQLGQSVWVRKLNDVSFETWIGEIMNMLQLVIEEQLEINARAGTQADFTNEDWHGWMDDISKAFNNEA